MYLSYDNVGRGALQRNPMKHLMLISYSLDRFQFGSVGFVYHTTMCAEWTKFD